DLVNQIKEKALSVKPTIRITRIKDIPDNRVLECAACAKVPYIVTGNKHHFTFKQFKGIRIANPREFLIVFLAEES
ncbi:PIN domain-containing protein, partial [bacterium]|nr:PIN domain-containing protein [bacterium]